MRDKGKLVVYKPVREVQQTTVVLALLLFQIEKQLELHLMIHFFKILPISPLILYCQQ